MTINKIELTWTVNPQAISQEVQRAESNSGPWTTLATLSATASTYTDNTVVSNPHTDYFYRIKTICSSGTDYSTVTQEESRCCPTNNKANIFGIRRSPTNNDPVTVTYVDRASDFVLNNSSYYTNPKHTTIADKYESISPNSNINIICPNCGDEFTKTGTGDAQLSMMGLQKHITQYLPNAHSTLGGSANAGMGNVFRKYNNGTGYVGNTKFELGIGETLPNKPFVPWYTGAIKLNSAGTAFVNVPTSQYNTNDVAWEFAKVPVVDNNYQVSHYKNCGQLRISRYGFNNTTFNSIYDNNAYSNATTIDQGSALNNVGVIPSGQSNSNWYLSIIDAGDPDMYYPNTASYYNRQWICYHRLYNIIRRTDWDLYNSSNVLVAYGYQIIGWNTYTHNNKTIGGTPLINKLRRYGWGEQPNCILKIFQA